MKRYFTIVCMFSLLLTSAVAATTALPASGNTRGDAIEFDWENGHQQPSSATGISKWYKVDITRLDSAQHPALALYSTNLSTTETVDVKAVVYPQTGNASLCDWSFQLKPGAFRVESEDFSRAREMGYTHVYILMTAKGSTSNVALTVKEYEWERIKEDRDCNRFREVVVNGQVRGVDFPATDPEWFSVNISDYLTGNKLLVTVENRASESQTFTGRYSYDCPCTGSTPIPTMTVAPHGQSSFYLTVNELQAIAEDHLYLNIKATGAFGVSVKSESDAATAGSLPPYVDYIWGSQTDFPMGENWMRVAADSLTQMLYVPYVTLSSTVAEPKNITCQLGYVDAAGKLVLLPDMDWSFSGNEVTFPLDVNVLMAMPKEYRKNGYIFFHVTCDQDVKIGVGVQESLHSADCLSAIEFDYENGNVVPAHTSQWIHVDLSNKTTKYQVLRPHMTNLAAVKEKIHVEVALECPYKEYYSADFTLDKNETSPKLSSLDGWLAHELYDMADEFWMRVTTETDTRLWVEIKDEDFPEKPIVNLQELQLNTWYTVSDTETWYHYPTANLIDTTLFPKDAVPQITIVNPIGEKVTVHTNVAYHNPIDYTPLSVNPELEANDSLVRRVTRDIMEHYVGRNKDTYVGLTARYDKLNSAPNDYVRFMISMSYPTMWVVDTVYLYPCGGDVYTIEDPVYGGFAPFDCNVPDTMFTKIYPFHNDTVFRGDSMRTYVVHSLRLPLLPDTLRAAEIPALAIEPGDTIGAALQDKIIAEYIPYTLGDYMITPDWQSLSWNFLQLPTTMDITGAKQYITDACSDTLPMYISFRYEDNCENIIEHTLELQFRRRQPVIEIADTIRLQACYGTVVSDAVYGGFTPFTLTKDTTFTEHLYFNGADYCGDSARTYYIYGLRAPVVAGTLTRAEIPALGIDPADTLDAAFRAEVERYFWPMVTGEGFAEVDAATVAWDYMQLPMDYATDACLDINPMYIRLTYSDECGQQYADTFRVEFHRQVPHVTVEEDLYIRACQGQTVEDTYYGDFTPFVLTHDSLFTTHTGFANTLACGDSVRTYHIECLTHPNLAQPITSATIPALAIYPGSALDESFRTAVLKDFWPLVSDEHFAAVDSSTIAWDYLQLPMDYVTDICSDSLPMTISMSYKDECGTTLTNTFTVQFDRKVRTFSIRESYDIVACPGTKITDTRFGGCFTPFTLEGDTTFTVAVSLQHDMVCGDSIRTFHCYARQTEMMPVIYDTICAGQQYVWAGQTLTKAGTYTDSYQYAEGCDSIVYTLHLEVLEDYFTVVDDYEGAGDVHIPAYLKYGGSMLMLDLATVNKNLYADGQDQVTDSAHVDWYRVQGMPDIITSRGERKPASGDAVDQMIGHGYYLPVSAAASGAVEDYYAILNLPDAREACGVIYRSAKVSRSATARVSLAPNYAQQGQGVTVMGREGQQTVVRVFTAMGVTMMQMEAAADETCTFRTDGLTAGCYVVEVNAEGVRTSLRLVVE